MLVIGTKDCTEEMSQEFLMKFKLEGKHTFPASTTMFDDDDSHILHSRRTEQPIVSGDNSVKDDSSDDHRPTRSGCERKIPRPLDDYSF